MERTNRKKEVKKVPVQIDNRPMWQKTGGGSFRIGKRIIKPGQKFRAHDYEVPEAFRDTITQISGGETSIVVETKGIIPTYTMKETEKKGLFNILDENGKKVNEKPLDEAIAKDLLKDLQ